MNAPSKPRPIQTDPPVEIHPVTLSGPDANRSAPDTALNFAAQLVKNMLLRLAREKRYGIQPVYPESDRTNRGLSTAIVNPQRRERTGTSWRVGGPVSNGLERW